LVPLDRDSLARVSNLALLGLRAIPLRTGLHLLLYHEQLLRSHFLRLWWGGRRRAGPITASERTSGTAVLGGSPLESLSCGSAGRLWGSPSDGLRAAPAGQCTRSSSLALSPI